MQFDIIEFNLAKPIFYLCLAISLLGSLIEPAGAHRVNLFAWVEGDTVHGESKFSGGKRVNAGKITVTDPEGTILLTGTTDENGEFSFKIPQKSDLKIVLLAGTGHRAEWTVTADEIEKPVSEKEPVPGEGFPIIEISIGMGCIFGLTAIIAYIRNRRRKYIDHENTKI